MDRKNTLEVYNGVMKKILLYAQASLPESRFTAFRKLVLDEFGSAAREVNHVVKEQHGLARVK